MSGSTQRLNVAPTITMMGVVKTRLIGATKGHQLLKKKSDALTLQFRHILLRIVDAKETMGELMKASAFSLTEAKYAAGEGIAFLVAESVGAASLRVRAHQENVAGVKLPRFEPLVEVVKGELTGLAQGGQQILLCRAAFLKVVEVLVELASLQTSFLTLDAAIKTTNRRVNALESVVKPKLENTIAYIRTGLDELEREEFFRLKKVQAFKKKEVDKLKAPTASPSRARTMQPPPPSDADQSPLSPRTSIQSPRSSFQSPRVSATSRSRPSLSRSNSPNPSSPQPAPSSNSTSPQPASRPNPSSPPATSTKPNFPQPAPSTKPNFPQPASPSNPTSPQTATSSNPISPQPATSSNSTSPQPASRPNSTSPQPVSRPNSTSPQPASRPNPSSPPATLTRANSPRPASPNPSASRAPNPNCAQTPCLTRQLQRPDPPLTQPLLAGHSSGPHTSSSSPRTPSHHNPRSSLSVSSGRNSQVNAGYLPHRADDDWDADPDIMF